MTTVLGEEIDVLAKAKRAIAGNYVPDEADPYMSEAQLDYYRRLLLEWKKLIHTAAQGTLQQLQDGPIREPDLNDRASSETDWGIELRTRDRQCTSSLASITTSRTVMATSAGGRTRAEISAQN